MMDGGKGEVGVAGGCGSAAPVEVASFCRTDDDGVKGSATDGAPSSLTNLLIDPCTFPVRVQVADRISADVVVHVQHSTSTVPWYGTAYEVWYSMVGGNSTVLKGVICAVSCER